MCGIIAYAGKDLSNFNYDKFKILGIYNDSRGGDGCGVSVDGTLHKGILANRLFSDFIAKTPLPSPSMHPTLIGHTRKSSVGLKTLDNTHPFSFKYDDNSVNSDLMGVHNGTVYNHLDIANKYGINSDVSTTIKNENTGSTVYNNRSKIDSEILLEAIHRTNDIKVLEEYNGGAALVWYDPNEPNVLYCFHGSSKYSHYNNWEEEERPLFYYSDSENSTYISSLKESLFAIGGTAESVKSFDTNIVYKITDGNISKAIKMKVDRSKCLQTKNYYDDINYGNTKVKTKVKNVNTSKSNITTNHPLNIHGEKIEGNMNSKKGKLIFNKLRFRRNGHLVTGIYTYIKGHGYFELSKDLSTARELFWFITNKEFRNGRFSKTITNETLIPFKHTDKNPILLEPLTYFYRGVMLKTSMDYEQLVSFNQDFDVYAISHASKHPVCNIGHYPVDNQGILLDGDKYTGRFTLLGSDRLYNIKNGNLIGSRSINPAFNAVSKNKNIKKDVESSKEVKDELISIIKNDLKNNNKLESSENNSEPLFNDDDILKSDLDKMLLNFYTSLPSMISQTKKYESTKFQKQVVENLEDIIMSIEEIIASA